MSNKQKAAIQKAFERGQEAWRAGMGRDNDNPFPPEAPYHECWRQGWDQEQALLD